MCPQYTHEDVSSVCVSDTQVVCASCECHMTSCVCVSQTLRYCVCVRRSHEVTLCDTVYTVT